MDYSIVIPVFNKAELTRNCLASLQASLEGAGEGEVIVIDNASTDHTARMLESFPWVRVIRNNRNLGFSGANNQGAREARGRILVLLNNDTQAITKWLAPMMRLLDEPRVGVVGARLLFADHTIQHAGVIVRWWPFSAAAMHPIHYLFKNPADTPQALVRRDLQIVTGACMATPRDLYLELGGLDEGFWNGYEDVDYCLKVRERGLRVVYEPEATLFHYESKSGAQRFRRTQANLQRLSERWRGRVQFDASRVFFEAGRIEGVRRGPHAAVSMYLHHVKPVDVLVHGLTPETDRAVFERSLRDNLTPIGTLVWSDGDSIADARALTELRGDRYVALVRADGEFDHGWLDELLARVAAPANAAAATFVEGVLQGRHAGIVASDARCVLLRMSQFPQHLRLEDAPSLDRSVANFLVRALELERATIGVAPLARLGPPLPELEPLFDRSASAVERVLRDRPPFERGLISIVTLSWNAPEFTVKALASIRANTAEPYEVIVVDNGSKPETLKMLASIDDPHVRVIYNATNRGFAGGNNDGIAHARGDYVIVLNNDVIVTPGWADGLVDAFRRIPGLGISAPRSNQIAGDQQLADVRYRDESEMHAFAVSRRREFSQKGYITDRAIGFCWCIPRHVLDEIGALDERYMLGNFEDDDYCMRVRAAGYYIYVCDDVFIHHFGSRSFAANGVDYSSTMHENWAKFSKKWGMSGPLPTQGYRGGIVHGRGFIRKEHYIPFPPPRVAEISDAERGIEAAAALDRARSIFGIAVRSESDWSAAAQFVRRFALAFKAEDEVALAIAAFAEPSAYTIASRVERILEKAEVSQENCANIDIADYDNDDEWGTIEGDPRFVDVRSLADRSPSALRRLIGTYAG